MMNGIEYQNNFKSKEDLIKRKDNILSNIKLLLEDLKHTVDIKEEQMVNNEWQLTIRVYEK